MSVRGGSGGGGGGGSSSNIEGLLPARSWLKRIGLLVGLPLLAAFILMLILWKTFIHYVPPGKMLIVISKGGDLLDEGQVLARAGQKGILEEVRGEGWHFVMPIIYTTELKDNIVIEPGKVGIVTAKGGKPLSRGVMLAEAGEQGIRREVLLPGSYRLNPYGYTVETVPMVKIEPGFVGVLRRKLASKDDKGEILKPGILKDRILQPGIYPINDKEYQVIPCEIGIDQTTYNYRPEDPKSAISFPGKDGFPISLECTIEWELKPEYWPDWLARFPDFKQIESIVVDQHARRISRDRGLNYGAQDFLDGKKREEFQDDFREELKKECLKDNVIIRSAYIRNIIIPESFLRQKRLERLVIETRLTSEQLKLTRETEAEVAEAKQTIELRKQKVEAGTEKLVAAIDIEVANIKTVTEAEVEQMKDEFSAEIAKIDAQRKKVLGEADAEARKLKDTAESAIYKMKMEAFGRDGDAYLRYTMAEKLNPKMQLRLFQSGPGTLWTNMGNKNMNLFMPLPGADSVIPKGGSSGGSKEEK